MTPAALTKQRARQDSTINRVCHFVDEALENAEGVLIHSVRGSSRSCTILVAYLVKKCATRPRPAPDCDFSFTSRARADWRARSFFA